MKDAIDSVLTAGVTNGAVPGAIAIVVDRDGVRYLGSAGERSIGTGTPMTTDTVGAIASMTKAVTGAAAMQLVEQGKIDLDAPMSDVCPEAANPTVLEGFDGDGQPITRPAATEPTLRQLLTHTSGFAYDVWHADMTAWYAATGAPPVLSRQRAAVRTPLAFDPGTQWQYGHGIDWAGLMIEAASGQTLGEYFAQNVTGPLGMTDTSFSPTDSMLERAASIHARMPDGSLVPYELPQAENPEFEMGGGGLYSTMSDYGSLSSDPCPNVGIAICAESTIREQDVIIEVVIACELLHTWDLLRNHRRGGVAAKARITDMCVCRIGMFRLNYRLALPRRSATRVQLGHAREPRISTAVYTRSKRHDANAEQLSGALDNEALELTVIEIFEGISHELTIRQRATAPAAR